MPVSVNKVKAVDRHSNTITYKIQLSAPAWLAESLTELKCDDIFQYYDGEYSAHPHNWRSPVRIDTSRGGKSAREQNHFASRCGGICTIVSLCYAYWDFLFMTRKGVAGES